MTPEPRGGGRDDPLSPATEAPEWPATDRPGRASWRRLPLLIGRALKLVWRAAGHDLVTYLVIQGLAAVGVGVALLLGRRVLSAVVAGPSGGYQLGDLAPELIGLGVVTALLGFAAAVFSARNTLLSELVERHVQGQIMDAVSAVELDAFESPEFHDRLRRARVNAANRSWEVTYGVMSMSTALAGVVVLFAVLTGVQPFLLPAVLVAYLPLWLVTSRNSRASYDFAYAMTAPDRERAYLGEVLTGKDEAKEVRLFDLSGFLRRRYDDLYDRRLQELRHVMARRMRRSLLGNTGSSAATLIGIMALVQLTLTGRITPADAGVAAVALQQLGARLRALDAGAGSLLECGLFLDDLVRFLDLQATRLEERTDGSTPAGFRHLSVEAVSFTYRGARELVLDQVSLEIGSGEVVALVGRNGSGKTTLAKILCGLYRPTSGRVLWDGVDVSRLDPAALRRGATAIFQDFVKYELTAQDNIGLGKHSSVHDLEAIRKAAQKGGVDELLASLPMGYSTRLSRSFEGGTELSAGEWQRVALARAFFRDAPFLVLDEPTASLDAEAELQLFDGIRALQRGRAVLLISHRFSSVRSADRIYVLHEGRVHESGTHEELMRRGGRYARLFRLQADAYLDGYDQL